MFNVYIYIYISNYEISEAWRAERAILSRFNPLSAKTLIVYNATLPYIPKRNNKTSPHVECFYDVHAHAYFQFFFKKAFDKLYVNAKITPK